MSTPSGRIYELSGEAIERLLPTLAQQLVQRVPGADRAGALALLEAGLAPGADPVEIQVRARDAMARIEAALGGSPGEPGFTHDGSAPALADVALWALLRWQVESDVLDVELAIETCEDVLIHCGATPGAAQQALHHLIDEAVAQAAQAASA